MGSKVEYVDSSHMYATNYVRNSKAIGVLWGIFTICYAIIAVVAFVTPEWMGDTMQGSENPARFGLWSSCSFGNSVGVVEDCQGRLDDLSSIPSLPGKVATILAALSVLVALITIVAMLLFFFIASTKVFHLCGWMQVISAVCMLAASLVFPLSWTEPEVLRTCGQTAGVYAPGDCSLRWAYLLAVIGCLDAFILAVLAFILATRHVKLQPEPTYGMNGSLYKGEVNGGFMGDAHSVAGSRKSLNLHPVLLMPQPGDADRYSEFSNRTGRSKNSGFRPDYGPSMHNFQL
ncbi:LHFPL tetraspan subfamily member 3 protein [Macrosteles quadrilineatus]|uniref:LHFPL tetraspan subfamily member 3 protein n=1 Tax=Macrosteles quadrilineatus TaxID=74068 RepID=UPI0023E2B270|nr:LHFPL tetraspan subfamily member 3 protein [Macrosteles quadrilineatus]